MTPEQIDHVFGRGRLKMETGAHVEVFREAAPPGESRRYTKRFLTTADGDYAQWTEREWRILALLVGHGSRCVPDIVQYDRDARGTKLVQTYDAGATVDQWATLLPVQRGGSLYARVFEDCAHWWALAHHCLVALDEIHSLQLVHLDIKGDNICIPIGPAEFDPAALEGRLFPMFGKLRLIDFAFSLVSGESLPTPLPIGWQQDYDYQSPRLLHALEAGRAGDLRPTENLDWRCDMYSLAAMLKRYLPGEQRLCQPELACGWTAQRYDAAKALILKIREAHDRELTLRRPHAALIVETSAHVRENALAQSLEQGWTLARDAQPFAAPATPLTPVTRLALPLRLVIPPRDDHAVADPDWPDERFAPPFPPAKRRDKVPLVAGAIGIAAVAVFAFAADSGSFLDNAAQLVMETRRSLSAAMNRVVDPESATGAASPAPADKRNTATLPVGTSVPDATAAPETVAAAGGPGTQENTATEAPATPQDAPVAATESSESTPSLDASQSQSSAPTPESAESANAPQASAAVEAPPSSARAGNSTLPSLPPPRASSSRSRQTEGYRSKPASTPSRVAKAPSPPPSATAQAAPARNADAARRTQLAGSAKAPRATTVARAATTRSPQVATKKRTGETTFVASRVPPNVPPTQVASNTPSASTPAVAPSVAGTAGTASAAIAPNDAAAGAGSAAPGIATAPSSAQVVASISAPSQPATAPRAVALPQAQASPVVAMPDAPAASTYPLPNAAGSAPIVEASPPPAAPIVTGPRPPASRSLVEAPPPLAAPIVVAPRSSPPRAIAEPPRPRSSPNEIRDGDAYRAQARWILENVVPRTSAQSHAQISRVLLIAASAYHPDQERAVFAAAASPGVVNDVAFVARDFAPLDARRLHDEARQAYLSRRDIPDALDLQLKAFGANPYDPEITGYLAFLYMKVLPAQPDRARQLALYAIGLRNGQYRTGRAEDWTTFAIASALTGHETDARYAFYTLVALTRNADRVCHEALGALALYGDRLREPVDALLYRLHAQGRADDSSYCAWPASRITRNP